jgi:hypothetical protein
LALEQVVVVEVELAVQQMEEQVLMVVALLAAVVVAEQVQAHAVLVVLEAMGF